MPKSIFDRDIFFKMEQLDNPFIAARALSIRAREVNTKQEEESDSAPVLALDDFLKGRINFTQEEDESFVEN